MIQLVTQGIRVSIRTRFEGAFIRDGVKQYAFAYTIHIKNEGKNIVQLKNRHWQIKDALNEIDLVYGEGVVGKKPVIKPGESYTYSSGCLLKAPFGSMSGWYEMINFETTEKFKVKIPSFKLNAAFAMN
ncbi:MAG: Co2+/Mg2+ efflux protein ApaG [Patiriisocius sp.]|uniref:Co2+/Mg2+ efflux protein ApaG n=1 Tax=Patiriisocius sp. TaxID=2822396 RepID=UPI003EF7D672